MELYPVIDAMSQGQRSLLSYVDFGEMIMTGNYGEDNWKELNESVQEDIKTTDALSIYAGIDRSTFQPAGIALTSEARQIQSTTGTSYANKLFGIDTTYIKIAGYATSVALIGAGIFSLVHSGSLKKSAETVITESRQVHTTLTQKTQAISGDFHTYLKSKNIVGVDLTDITGNAKQEAMDFEKVDVKPTFDGDFNLWIKNNLKYPEQAKADKVQGRVIVQFTIGTDGTVSDVKLLRGVHEDLNAEALRVVSSMPKWEPGKKDGKAVPVSFTIPIVFRFQ